MLNKVAFSLLVSTALGYLSGQGVGGGSLLMLWLTIVIGLDYPVAKTVNLLFYIPAVAVSLLLHKKQSTLPVKKLLPIMAGSVLGAILFSCLSPFIKTEWVRKIFGGLLIIVGIRELQFRER